MPEALSEPKTEQAQERDKRPAPLAERNEQLRLTCGSYRIIGQVFDCYWIVQQDEDTFFIDNMLRMSAGCMSDLLKRVSQHNPKYC